MKAQKNKNRQPTTSDLISGAFRVIESSYNSETERVRAASDMLSAIILKDVMEGLQKEKNVNMNIISEAYEQRQRELRGNDRLFY